MDERTKRKTVKTKAMETMSRNRKIPYIQGDIQNGKPVNDIKIYLEQMLQTGSLSTKFDLQMCFEWKANSF